MVNVGSKERKLREKETVRKSILDTALEIVADEGWEAVTIRRIADAIEYAPPIVYEHFKNKKDLLEHLILFGHRMLHSNYEKVKKNENDPRKIILHLSESHWDFAFKYSQLYKLMFSIERPAANEEIKTIILEVKKLFQKISNGKEETGDLMFSWMCINHGFIFSVMRIEKPSKLIKTQPKKLFINSIERFLRGI